MAFVLDGSLIEHEHDKKPDQNMAREITGLNFHSVKGKIWGRLMNLWSLWTMTWEKTRFSKKKEKRKTLFFSRTIQAVRKIDTFCHLLFLLTVNTEEKQTLEVARLYYYWVLCAHSTNKRVATSRRRNKSFGQGQ